MRVHFRYWIVCLAVPSPETQALISSSDPFFFLVALSTREILGKFAVFCSFELSCFLGASPFKFSTTLLRPFLSFFTRTYGTPFGYPLLTGTSIIFIPFFLR